MNLRHRLAQTLLVSRLIEDALYGDHEWAIHVECGAVSPADVIEIEDGVCFTAPIPGDYQSIPVWLLRDGEPVFHVYIPTIRAGDDVSLILTVGERVVR